MARRVGIIGYPIGHSISPVFQQAALDHCGIDAHYQAWEVAPQDLGEFVRGLRSPDALGCNVTVPHKEAVMRYLDRIEDWAAVAGAVNTVVSRSGDLIGYNTDGQGFLRALEERGRFSPRGLRVLVLGAGGAARAVCLALAQGGAEAITIANRTLERAEVLARLVKGHCPQVVPITLKPESIARAVPRCDLVVNCTTLGMKHGPAEGVNRKLDRLVRCQAPRKASSVLAQVAQAKGDSGVRICNPLPW